MHIAARVLHSQRDPTEISFKIFNNNFVVRTVSPPDCFFFTGCFSAIEVITLCRQFMSILFVPPFLSPSVMIFMINWLRKLRSHYIYICSVCWLDLNITFENGIFAYIFTALCSQLPLSKPGKYCGRRHQPNETPVQHLSFTPHQN